MPKTDREALDAALSRLAHEGKDVAAICAVLRDARYARDNAHNWHRVNLFREAEVKKRDRIQRKLLDALHELKHYIDDSMPPAARQADRVQVKVNGQPIGHLHFGTGPVMRAAEELKAALADWSLLKMPASALGPFRYPRAGGQRQPWTDDARRALQRLKPKLDRNTIDELVAASGLSKSPLA